MLQRTLILAVLIPFLVAGCGKGTDDSKSAPATAAPGGEAPARAKKRDKDRGEATMMIGSTAWEAERTRATLANGKLTIRASNTDVSGKKVSRQELHLQIDGYTGPGTYTTGISGSRFIGVGIDAKAAAAATTDEAAVESATDLLSKADHLMLSGAKVTITDANDREISGMFQWDPPGGKKPAITNGVFRALLAD